MNFKKMGLLSAAAVGIAVSAGVAPACAISISSVTLNNPTGYLPGSQIITFDSIPSGVTVSGGAIVQGSSGVYATPFLDDTKYLTVAPSSASQADGQGPATISLGTLSNYYGLYWGSIDDYNTIEFLNGTTVLASFTGKDIINPANGNQAAGGSAYVNFVSSSNDYFDSVRLTSTNFAFESDNHAYRAVPTPALLPGLIGMGIAALRKRKGEASEEIAEEVNA